MRMAKKKQISAKRECKGENEDERSRIVGWHVMRTEGEK